MTRSDPDSILESIARTSSSRRRVLSGVGILGGSLAISSLAHSATRAGQATARQSRPDEELLAVLLEMERLQVAVFEELAEAIEDGEVDGLVSPADLSRLIDVQNDVLEHERAHVERFETELEDRGGEIPSEESFSFASDDVLGLVGTAERIEREGLGLYATVVPLIDDPDLASLVASVYGVEGRHVGALLTVDGLDPFDDAFERSMPIEDAEAFVDEFASG